MNRNKRETLGFIVLIIFIVAGCLGFLAGYVNLEYRNPETIEGVVTQTYIKRYNETDYFHVVIEYDNGTKEVFQNRDAFWVGKFNSADMQLEFEVGKRYEFDVRGTRWQFMSMFRNIVAVRPIS